MKPQRDTENWGAELARISAQLDDLRARTDDEYQTLHLLLDMQVVQLQAALRRLEADVRALRPDAYARRVAAQIEELKSRGDAAYERLQASAPGPAGLTPSPSR
jgi:hypothetical protein